VSWKSRRWNISGGFFLIERDTDPTRLSPDNMTMVIAVLCVDNQLGMPIWLSTSRFPPLSEMLRTKQSIPEPPNKIVPAFMTFWRWSRLLFITAAQMQAFKFLQID
jgi:hypothetical protein